MLDRIALDMDGVLYDWEGNLRTLIAEAFDIPEPPRTTTWKMQWMTKDHWTWYHQNIHRVFGEGEAIRGALKGAAALLNLTTELAIVTSGTEAACEAKLDWLDANDVAYDSFYLVPLSEKKPDHCVADLYVDDSPHVVDDVIRETMATAVLFDQLYNDSYHMEEWPNPRIIRAVGWPAAVRIATWYTNRKDGA